MNNENKAVDLSSVPESPGVYLWKNKYGEIIYIGKANKLKTRMKQYFKNMINSFKTSKMVEEISSFDYVITNSGKEALILERNLIEKHSPEFNILLTDDKRYPYIWVNLSDRLEIRLVYRIRSLRKRGFLFGPFPNGYGAKTITNLLNRLTTYNKGIPDRSTGKEYWQSKYDYAISILKTNTSKLIKDLESKMFLAAEKEHFELANDFKKSVNALKELKENQIVELKDNRNIDVFGFVVKDNYLSVCTLFYRNGILLSKESNVLQLFSSSENTARQFVSRYYHVRSLKPELIVSNMDIETTDDLKLIVPQKGDLKKIETLAIKNATDNIEQKLEKYIRKTERRSNALLLLKQTLSLKKISVIQMIDNSNTNNTNPVSAIVTYKNGIKQKQLYRKYNLILNSRLADVDYMEQAIETHFIQKEYPVPDLFIVDGGIQQWNVAKNIIPKANVIGLVKNEKHKTESYIDLHGNKQKFASKELLHFLSEIQIEVDRFAKFHHASRRKKTLEGTLLKVKGIGPATESRLLEHFKTYSGIYNASLEELQKVVSETNAKKIKKYLLHNVRIK